MDSVWKVKGGRFGVECVPVTLDPMDRGAAPRWGETVLREDAHG